MTAFSVRWRVVELHDESWYMLHDALVRESAVERIRSHDPDRGDDDRAVVDLVDGRELRAHFLGPSDREDDRPDVTMGFRRMPDESSYSPGWIEFADGPDRLADVVAIVRSDELVLCYPRDSAAPARFHRALPYPWQARTS